MEQSTTTTNEDILKRAQALARLLDASIPVPGTDKRIGIDGIISLIPGIGDSASAVLSSYIIYQAYLDGVSRWTLTRMVGNVLIDVLLGSVPFFGDIADFFWKSNLRNISLWTNAIERGRKRRQLDRLIVVGFFLGMMIVVGCAIWVSLTILSWMWRQITAGPNI